jgi:two-component system C4-dicarboxylate transport sensor histidine kinase DctB
VGLGLAISSGIVAELGGRLTARNGARGGAVFEVVLPRLDRAREAQPRPAADAAAPVTHAAHAAE